MRRCFACPKSTPKEGRIYKCAHPWCTVSVTIILCGRCDRATVGLGFADQLLRHVGERYAAKLPGCPSCEQLRCCAHLPLCPCVFKAFLRTAESEVLGLDVTTVIGACFGQTACESLAHVRDARQEREWEEQMECEAEEDDEEYIDYDVGGA